MIKKELEKITQNPEALALYAEGMSALHRSGILGFLKLLGQPVLVFDGKDSNAMAAQAARSIGWNGCMNTLINFREIILEATEAKASPKIAFDGLTRAVQRGDLLEEEANAIRAGKRPDKSIYQPTPLPNATGHGGRSGAN